MTTNPACPDHTAHDENAAERYYPAGVPERIPADAVEAIDADALAEYLACEGHG